MKPKYLSLTKLFVAIMASLLAFASCESTQTAGEQNQRTLSATRSGARSAALDDENARLKAESDRAAQEMASEEGVPNHAKKKPAYENDRLERYADPVVIPTERLEKPVVAAANTGAIAAPLVDFVVKGRMLGENGKPLPGMQVVLLVKQVDATPENINLASDEVREIVIASSDTTDALGQFEVHTFGEMQPYVRLFVRDIDGPSKGSYQNEVINIPFSTDDYEDSGHGWREGVAVKEMTLRPKMIR